MRNQPISPQEYSSPPSSQDNTTTEQRLVEIAYCLTDLSAELLQLVTSPTADTLHYPSTRYFRQSTARNQEEHRQEAHNNRVRRQLLGEVQETTTRAIAELALHTNQVQRQEREAHINLLEVRESTNKSSATSVSKNSEVTPEITTSSSAKTAPTSRRRSRAARSSEKKSATTTSRTTKHTIQQQSPTTEYKPGDQVQVIGGKHYKGCSGEVIKDTGKQLCIRIGRNIIYRKK